LDWSRFKDFIWQDEEARRRKSGYKRLEKVYRRFASYSEDNNDYVGASDFRFTASDIADFRCVRLYIHNV
jgi:hypothetical protein